MPHACVQSETDFPSRTNPRTLSKMAKRSFSNLSAEDQALLAPFPRDFAAIPELTDYGTSDFDTSLNKAAEAARLSFLEQQLKECLQKAAEDKKTPIFTIALIAGDCVILDALAKAGLLTKVKIIFVDTYTLFPETVAFLHEVEQHYGFKALVYHAKGIETQQEYDSKYRSIHFDSAGNLQQDQITPYDTLCKVEPLNRAIEEYKSECWINGRRRDHGDMRASLSVWEGGKLNPLAMWSFEDCWLYLRRNNVPYHPLHDVGYASLGDKHSTIKVANDKWMLYKGERSGRFVGLNNADGSKKTECGIHKSPAKKAKTSDTREIGRAHV